MFLVIAESNKVWCQLFSQSEVMHILKFYLAKHLIDAYLYYTTSSSFATLSFRGVNRSVK